MNANTKGPEEASGFNRGKAWTLCFSLAMAGAVLWPVHENWRSTPRDSFPLSYYPMFSAKRSPVEIFHYIVGYNAAGGRYLIPHSFVGAGGLNAVRRQINRMIREEHADELAARLARKVAGRKREPWSKIVRVAVVTGRYRVDDYFHGKKEPVSERIRGKCAVERSSE